MSTITTGDPGHPVGALRDPSDRLQERLAEAARYAVLRRIAPVLRHEMAGLMQPVGMLMMVLQRRVQMSEPDLQAIAKTVVSVNALAKEATTGCMNAMGWMASREDTAVGLRSSIDDAAKLLAMDLSAQGLEISNLISDDGLVIPQSFFRSLLVGALLAFCDQRMAGTMLQISLDREAENGTPANRLMLRMLLGDAPDVPHAPDEPDTPDASDVPDMPSIDSSSRLIDWADVEAMSRSFGVTLERGDGWLAVGLPSTG